MASFTEAQLRRERLRRAIYSRLNNDPEVAGVFGSSYSNVWLVARKAADVVLELEDAVGNQSVAPPSEPDDGDRKR